MTASLAIAGRAHAKGLNARICVKQRLMGGERHHAGLSMQSEREVSEWCDCVIQIREAADGRPGIAVMGDAGFGAMRCTPDRARLRNTPRSLTCSASRMPHTL